MLGQTLLEIMKVIYNQLTESTARELLGVSEWGDPDEFTPIYDALRKNVFHGLCLLDAPNLERVVHWAATQMQPVDTYQIVAELAGATRAKVKAEAFTAQYCSPFAPPPPRPEPTYPGYVRPYEVPENETKEDRERRLSWEHYDKYEALAQKRGIGALKARLPEKKEVLEKAYGEDRHLNNIPLIKWDWATAYPNADAIRKGFPAPMPPMGFFQGLSLAEAVCVLKHVAIYHVIGVEPPPKYEPNK